MADFLCSSEFELIGLESVRLQAREFWIGIECGAEKGKFPALIIRLLGPEEDIATRYDYKTETTVEYWDTVLLKRNPTIEIYHKVFGNTGSVHFRSEDHVFYTSWAGTQDRIRSAVDFPSRVILGLATGTPEDLKELAPDSVREQ